MPHTSRRMRIKALPRAIALALAGLAALPAAHAQAQAAEGDGKIQRVEITGSNIRRLDKETPSPVQVLTLQDIKASGYTEVSSVLRNITANGAGTLSQSFNGAFAGGASGVALRGLTVGATLVLIDGHRMAPYALSDDGQRSFVDISQIPLEAIERIEVLKDGASSIYGSDAIAGVVNVILKKNFVGAEVSAEYGMTSERDGRTSHASGIYGWGDLGADGHNAWVSLEYRRQQQILVSDRKGRAFTNTDWTKEGGNNLTAGVPNNLNAGFPGSITGYLIDPTTGEISAFLPGCNATSFAAGGCAYRNSGLQLQTPTENLNLIGSFTKRLGNDWELRVKGSVFASKAEQVNGYASTAGTGGQSSVAYGPGQLPAVTPVNAPIVYTVPANYPGNPTGAEQILQYNFANLGPNRTNFDSQTWRLVGDLTGTMGDWDVTASLGYSESIVKQTNRGSLNILNLQAALNDPQHPYLVGLAAAGNTAAQNEFIAPTVHSKATNKLEFVKLRGSRELMQLAGGPLSVGVGGEFMHRDLDSRAPESFANGTQIGNNAFAIGTQNVAAAFVEVVAPVLKNLELDGALRHDRYNGSSSATTPKAGFKWAPVSTLSLRGTYAEGFRAPNPAENGTAGQSFFYTTYRDPILCPNDGTDPTTVAGNYPQQCNVALLGVQQTNRDLKPETSKSWTLGMIFEPSKAFSLTADFYRIKIDNQIISASSDPSYDVEQHLVRGTPTLQPFNGTPANGTPPVGNILFAPFPYINAQYTTTTGVDLDARYMWDMGSAGKLTTELIATHVFKYAQGIGSGPEVRLEGTHGPSGVSGDTGNPKDRAQLILTYDRGPLRVTGTLNWISSFNVTDPTLSYARDCEGAINSSFSGPAFSGAVPSQYCKVNSFTTFDLYAGYQVNKNLSIHASVQNLFNREAPLDFQTYGGAGNSFYDAALHQSGAVGRFINVGATYKF